MGLAWSVVGVSFLSAKDELPLRLVRSLGVDSPSQIAIINRATTPRLVVASCGSNQLIVASLDGVVERTVDHACPTGVAENPDTGLLYVSEAQGHIDVLDAHSLKRVTSFGSYGQEDGHLVEPAKLAVRSNKLYVADRGAHRVKVWDVNTNTFVASIGEVGGRDAEFDKPEAVATSADRLFVADSQNHRIQVFDLTYRFLFAFGRKGKKSGQFNKPRDVVVHKCLLYVADLDRLQVFTLEGTLVAKFDAPAVAVNVDDGGTFYVSDATNVQLFNHPTFHRFQHSHCERAKVTDDDPDLTGIGWLTWFISRSLGVAALCVLLAKCGGSSPSPSKKGRRRALTDTPPRVQA